MEYFNNRAFILALDALANAPTAIQRAHARDTIATMLMRLTSETIQFFHGRPNEDAESDCIKKCWEAITRNYFKPGTSKGAHAYFTRIIRNEYFTWKSTQIARLQNEHPAERIFRGMRHTPSTSKSPREQTTTIDLDAMDLRLAEWRAKQANVTL